MSLKKFKFHSKPDVRLVVMDNTVYKIKLTCQRKSESQNLKELCKATCCQSELEKAVCAILYTDKQEPILTESFVIYPFTEYGQKNRHDIESQNMREHLRMQEMAKPSLKTTEEETSKPTGFIK
ncbi:uncharacterized protein LOC116306278 [Actinia tenebrosa]|uniref:Uncharacterized protein LOC116306278 n=1 Tax=Actinia tenebrosa TaxID=6105 RepID=A0A6P8IYB6_ACTTE|nr:uncharacterized protein LOC116306278 [Actinia tenebrosa]